MLRGHRNWCSSSHSTALELALTTSLHGQVGEVQTLLCAAQIDIWPNTMDSPWCPRYLQTSTPTQQTTQSWECAPEQQPSIRSTSQLFIHNQDDIPELTAASIVWELVLWEQKIAQQKKIIRPALLPRSVTNNEYSGRRNHSDKSKPSSDWRYSTRRRQEPSSEDDASTAR